MISGEFDLQTTLLVIGAALGVVILLWLLLRSGRRRQSLRAEEQERVEARVDDPYVVTKERPYMKPAAPPPAAAPPLSPPPPPPPPQATTPTDPEIEEAGPPPGEEPDRRIDVAQPAVPLAGEFASIAFPPHSTDHPDELTRMKGVGPKLAALLNQEGITRYEQLASLSDEEVAALDDRLGTFKGRLARDRVIEQARLLASGDTETYEARFGKLGG